MAVTIKSEREIALMRESCRILSGVFDHMAEQLRPGMSTYEVDAIGERLIRETGCIPNFKNYHG